MHSYISCSLLCDGNGSEIEKRNPERGVDIGRAFESVSNLFEMGSVADLRRNWKPCFGDKAPKLEISFMELIRTVEFANEGVIQVFEEFDHDGVARGAGCGVGMEIVQECED